MVCESPALRVPDEHGPAREVRRPGVTSVRLELPVPVPVHEVRRQVLGRRADLIEEDGVLRELGSLVRRWRRRAGELVPDPAERPHDGELADAERLEHRGLVEDYALDRPVLPTKAVALACPVELLIVRDPESVAVVEPRVEVVPVRQVGHDQLIPVEPARLGDRLPAHRQRGEDDHPATGVVVDVRRPVELHGGLAESGVGEQCEAFTLERTTHDPRLVIEQVRSDVPPCGRSG